MTEPAEQGPVEVPEGFGPCGWPDPIPGCCPCWDQASEAQQAFAAQVAADILWRLSGMRYGLCEVTVRPCGRDCDNTTYRGSGAPLFQPWLDGVVWVNSGCGCRSRCDCCDVCEVELPGPVDSITEVTIDGQTVPPAGYRVDDFRKLVRVGDTCWPTCQDLSAPTTEAGTFAVTYQLGMPLPPAGVMAYNAYTCEFVKACCGDKTCRLPARTRSISRQGVTLDITDPMEFLDRGRTGVAEVDLWLATVNPTGQRGSPAAVYSPDRRPPRVTTWGGGA